MSEPTADHQSVNAGGARTSTRWPGCGTATTAGIIALVAVLVGTLLGAVLGGLLGTRYHRKVDRVGYDS